MMTIEISSTDDISIYSNEYHMIEELIVYMEKNSYQLPQNFIFLQNLKDLTLYDYEFTYFQEDISYLLYCILVDDIFPLFDIAYSVLDNIV